MIERAKQSLRDNCLSFGSRRGFISIPWLLVLVSSVPAVILTWPLLLSIYETMNALAAVLSAITHVALWSLPAAALLAGVVFWRRHGGWAMLRGLFGRNRRPDSGAADEAADALRLDDKTDRDFSNFTLFAGDASRKS